MTSMPTKQQLTDEVAGLRELIAAVREIAVSAPRASYTDPAAKAAEYDRTRDILIRLEVLADLSRGSASPGIRAGVPRGYASEELEYAPAERDDDEDEDEVEAAAADSGQPPGGCRPAGSPAPGCSASETTATGSDVCQR
jgi:hypothetical protein